MAAKRPADSKVKIGTMMNRANFQRLKEHAVREGVSISDALDAAVEQFLKPPQKDDVEARIQRFLNPGFTISAKDLKSIMEEDYYDQ